MAQCSIFSTGKGTIIGDSVGFGDFQIPVGKGSVYPVPASMHAIKKYDGSSVAGLASTVSILFKSRSGKEQTRRTTDVGTQNKSHGSGPGKALMQNIKNEKNSTSDMHGLSLQGQNRLHGIRTC